MANASPRIRKTSSFVKNDDEKITSITNNKLHSNKNNNKSKISSASNNIIVDDNSNSKSNIKSSKKSSTASSKKTSKKSSKKTSKKTSKKSSKTSSKKSNKTSTTPTIISSPSCRIHIEAYDRICSPRKSQLISKKTNAFGSMTPEGSVFPINTLRKVLKKEISSMNISEHAILYTDKQLQYLFGHLAGEINNKKINLNLITSTDIYKNFLFKYDTEQHVVTAQLSKAKIVLLFEHSIYQATGEHITRMTAESKNRLVQMINNLVSSIGHGAYDIAISNKRTTILDRDIKVSFDIASNRMFNDTYNYED